MKRSTILAIAFLISPALAFSHSGRTDSQGGHTNRKTGEYHFHNKSKKRPPKSTDLKPFLATVVGVTDGDTVKVLTTDKKEVKIRLANIDAPEKRQPYGKRSKQTLSGLVYRKPVEIRPQVIDRYGRTVANVLFDGGVDASAVMVVKGWVYTKYNRDQSLLKLEAEAKIGQRGLWADPYPMAPWQWRRR